MTRYYFHAADGVAIRDEEGEELPGLQAAKDVALDVLTEMLPLKRRDFWAHKLFSVSWPVGCSPDHHRNNRPNRRA